eukprot:2391537-Ditylum_brightwellii.AAC.1
MTKTASFDLCGDKTSWGHQGWGEQGSGLCKCILNKPGICKRGQIVMLSGADCIRPCAYMHRHKLHPNPVGYVKGSNEVHMLMGQLEDMVIGEKSEKKIKKVFTKKPAMCFGNFFLGDKSAEEADKRGF